MGFTISFWPKYRRVEYEQNEARLQSSQLNKETSQNF